MKILWNTPNKDKIEYYGETYSVPLVAYDEKGQVLPYMVRWHFLSKGWVIATLPDGPNVSDYPEVNEEVDTWLDPQFYFQARSN